jgi:hypothetical protein
MIIVIYPYLGSPDMLILVYSNIFLADLLFFSYYLAVYPPLAAVLNGERIWFSGFQCPSE